MNIFPGSRWRHFRGGHYTVGSIALNVETDEKVVIYSSDVTGELYVRSVEGWLENVTTVDLGTVPRFTFIEG